MRMETELNREKELLLNAGKAIILAAYNLFKQSLKIFGNDNRV